MRCMTSSDARWMVVLALASGCDPVGVDAAPSSSATVSASTAQALPAMTATRSDEVSDKRLAISFEIQPGVRIDRVPRRTIVLRFRNPSASDPVRIYLPKSEAFRAAVSVLRFRSNKGASFFEPQPRPHGYTVTEADFHLIGPGEEVTFEQTFTLDPMKRGRGVETVRRAGFEDGATVAVSWSYDNEMTRWEGGATTLDGKSKRLFDGKEIPHIWTGKLSTMASWTIR